jgi:hypothetical protein
LFVFVIAFPNAIAPLETKTISFPSFLSSVISFANELIILFLKQSLEELVLMRALLPNLMTILLASLISFRTRK